ncbi:MULTISPECIES: hypothetical protein [Pontibacillus]|uniref:Uncharacterized protein n=1 Tax=Pontibacillus chungwhensis TaxID=265426 RepID=A0ABY8V4J3_9BACI|nr:MULTISPECIES: hypothetical protein [Pontibacillus]MCD5324797.1 hypothetical protein [Pontibacillus sp. HN14]WIF98756.1 hypothetical protein QNI29_03640 [Pontibacillus chungwhensis]
MPEQKEVEDMEKFMTLLMDVKVSVAEQSQKLDNVLDVKEKVEKTQETANEANRRSKRNEEDIEEVEKELKNKASKELLQGKADKSEVERIVQEKDNWKRNMPAWVAVAISAIAFLWPYLTNL